ncbi:MAG: YhcH/YjgK/YiaL family protein [Tannerella sp.]|jgi:YhcH/YjgK/YiaL family protein|nr:YhcH/YjgK/YiaL family protein [Tannerella sp.]
MILDSLENSHQYEALHPLFKRAFDFLKRTDFSQLRDGNIETNDPRLFYSISRFQGKLPQEAILETHRNYIDIQVPLIGVESIGWKAGNDLMIISKPYDTRKDIMFYHDSPTSYSKLLPGQFGLYFPEDGHAPGIGKGEIRKVIAKVAID